MKKQILAIAGSDATGGGGIQADLPTFQAFNTFSQAIITCIVSVDQTQEAIQIFDIPPTTLQQQLCTVKKSAETIAAVKIGMLGSLDNLKWLANVLKTNNFNNVVIDPVLVFKETQDKVSIEQIDFQQQIDFYKQKIIPYSFVLTPNLVEAELLSGITIDSVKAMEIAANTIHKLGAKYVVIKGGSRIKGNQALDLLYDGMQFYHLRKPKLETNRINGAGCTLASAIAAGLANGNSVIESVKEAKEFVFQGIIHGIAYNDEFGNITQTNFIR